MAKREVNRGFCKLEYLGDGMILDLGNLCNGLEIGVWERERRGVVALKTVSDEIFLEVTKNGKFRVADDKSSAEGK